MRPPPPIICLDRYPSWYILMNIFEIQVAFEWDGKKAAENLSKHGVSFVEAVSVLLSDETLQSADLEDPFRIVTIGFSYATRLLLVVSTEMGERVRIISARRA